jgi:hypothetical protein
MSLRNVTALQLGKATQVEEGWEVDGARLNLVRMVGRITRLTNDINGWRFALNDATGDMILHVLKIVSCPIESVEERIAREELEDLDPLTMPTPPWGNGVYMDVIGKPRGVGERVQEVDVTHMRPITDFNELTLHALQCIHEHCCLTQTEQ